MTRELRSLEPLGISLLPSDRGPQQRLHCVASPPALSVHQEGDALDSSVRTANDILINPNGTLERVEHEYEQRAASETDADGQTGLESQVALAHIEQVSEDVREKAETFEECEEALKERFAKTAD